MQLLTSWGTPSVVGLAREDPPVLLTDEKYSESRFQTGNEVVTEVVPLQSHWTVDTPPHPPQSLKGVCQIQYGRMTRPEENGENNPNLFLTVVVFMFCGLLFLVLTCYGVRCSLLGRPVGGPVSPYGPMVRVETGDQLRSHQRPPESRGLRRKEDPVGGTHHTHSPSGPVRSTVLESAFHRRLRTKFLNFTRCRSQGLISVNRSIVDKS